MDFESPTLLRSLTRFLAPGREHGLEGERGRHTSELRVVALDRVT